MRVVADRLSLRWYLGYDLTEPLPDHSSLTRLRERYGLDAFRRFFAAVTEQCVHAGLVWGRELYVDSTKVEADAALDSLQPRFAVEAHLADLFAGAEAAASGREGRRRRRSGERWRYRGAEHAGSAAAADRAHRRRNGPSSPTRRPRATTGSGTPGKPDREETSGSYRRTADFRVSTTDPDATPMQTKNGMALGYHDHYVVDGGKARIILTALVTPAEVQDNQPALDLLWQARFRWKLHPRQVTGDTKYGTVENVAAIEREGIRAYVPLSDVGHRAGLFRDTDFAYDAATDAYRCPGDATLHFLSQCGHTGRRIYEAPAAACRGVRAQGAVHQLPARPARWPQCGRAVPRPGARLPRHRALRQGDAETQGLGGAPLRRGQGLARPAPLPPAGAGEGQRRGAADRGGPKPEAIAESPGLGPPPVAEWGSRGDPPGGEPSRRLTMVSEVQPRIRDCPLRAATPAALFQQAGPFLRHLTPSEGRPSATQELSGGSLTSPAPLTAGPGPVDWPWSSVARIGDGRSPAGSL